VLEENTVKNIVNNINMDNNIRFDFKKHIGSTILYMSILLAAWYYYHKTSLNNYNLDIEINNNSEITDATFGKDINRILKKTIEPNNLLIEIKKIPYVADADIVNKKRKVIISFTSKKISAVVNDTVFSESGNPIGDRMILKNKDRYLKIKTNWIGDAALSSALSSLRECDTVGYIKDTNAYCGGRLIQVFDFYQQPNSISHIWRDK